MSEKDESLQAEHTSNNQPEHTQTEQPNDVPVSDNHEEILQTLITTKLIGKVVELSDCETQEEKDALHAKIETFTSVDDIICEIKRLKPGEGENVVMDVAQTVVAEAKELGIESDAETVRNLMSPKTTHNHYVEHEEQDDNSAVKSKSQQKVPKRDEAAQEKSPSKSEVEKYCDKLTGNAAHGTALQRDGVIALHDTMTRDRVNSTARQCDSQLCNLRNARYNCTIQNLKQAKDFLLPDDKTPSGTDPWERIALCVSGAGRPQIPDVMAAVAHVNGQVTVAKNAYQNAITAQQEAESIAGYTYEQACEYDRLCKKCGCSAYKPRESAQRQNVPISAEVHSKPKSWRAPKTRRPDNIDKSADEILNQVLNGGNNADKSDVQRIAEKCMKELGIIGGSVPPPKTPSVSNAGVPESAVKPEQTKTVTEKVVDAAVNKVKEVLQDEKQPSVPTTADLEARFGAVYSGDETVKTEKTTAFSFV